MWPKFSMVPESLAEEPARAWHVRLDAMLRVKFPTGPAFLPPTHPLGAYRTRTRRTARRILYRSRYYQNLSLQAKVRLMRKMMAIDVPGH